MPKMINIVNYLLRKAIESTNWDDTQEEIQGALTEQGFSSDEISTALAIAYRIRNRLATLQPIVIPKPSNQIFRLMELWKLSLEARGYLIGLRELGHISEMERQAVIDAAMQVDAFEVDLETIQFLASQVCGVTGMQGDSLPEHTFH